MNTKYLIPLAAAVLSGQLLVSCGSNEFKISGQAKEFTDSKLALEKADGAGSWMFIDSLNVDGKGSFAASVPSPAAPELYRLGRDGHYIYFPVDSVETLSINIQGKEIGRNFSVTGNPAAVAIARFDSLFNALPADRSEAVMNDFKRRAYTEFIAPSQGNLAGYYIITKTYNGKPIFNIDNADDAKYFAAVATAFEQFKPNDPRTQMLKNIATQSMRNAAEKKGKRKVVEAPEVRWFEIARPDTEGKTVKLSDHLGKGRPTVLIFTALGADKAPAYNAEIKKLYDAGRADIFMVGLDEDRYTWRNAAVNLPWTNVYDDEGVKSKALSDYNVTTIPVAFIFNSAGELIDRANSPSEIASKLR